MNKKLLSIVLTFCLVLTCVAGLSACGPKGEPPVFYGKTFELKELTVNYAADMNGTTTIGALIEENLQYIDWKQTIRANASSIDYATFEESVTTMARAKEIIATFGKDMIGATITFDDKDAKTATMTVGVQTEKITVVDNDMQGANATLKSSSGEEFAMVMLNYDDKTNEIKYLQFMPNVARSLTIYFTQEIMMQGIARSDFFFAFEINFTLKA